ncbi:NAD(P)H-dependent oxidoreductase [Oligoflexus tunisiensis]|uniref:NAD(P)H-dependent oxidoreductase n=1 Tax=Oligoflexus tunisiensis TaxID=708132 RepID=UPI000A69B9BB|nr:NAD(P)H-dependent oxidoreductase [Oligoflexus tunisiensis]
MNDLRRILVLYAHPNPEQSRLQKLLHAAIQDLEGVKIHDLYRLYPHHYIDVRTEQLSLQQADLIVFQYPLYWYSCPALLKEWQDTVLQQGFAYGPGGDALHGKDFLQVLSIGAQTMAWERQGSQRFSLSELLRPFEATAWLCGLHAHRPLLMQGNAGRTEEVLQAQAQQYRQLLVEYRQKGPEALRILNDAAKDSTHD